MPLSFPGFFHDIHWVFSTSDIYLKLNDLYSFHFSTPGRILMTKIEYICEKY